MQKRNSWIQFLREKGHLLALGLCAAAVIVSGYFFLRDTEVHEPETPTQAPVVVLPTPTEQQRPVFIPTPTEKAEQAATVGKPPAEEEQTVRTPQPVTPTEAKLQIVRPVEGETAGGYSMDQLAYNATTRDWRTHNGIDILAKEGVSVGAAAAGTVTAVYEDDLLGQTVTVSHDGGWVTHYSNLAPEVPVHAGDVVTAGQTLGTVGHTALLELADLPHLHFAVYKNNVPVNPEEFLNG